MQRLVVGGLVTDWRSSRLELEFSFPRFDQGGREMPQRRFDWPQIGEKRTAFSRFFWGGYAGRLLTELGWRFTELRDRLLAAVPQNMGCQAIVVSGRSRCESLGSLRVVLTCGCERQFTALDARRKILIPLF